MSITLRFAGLPQEEIVRILHNKFKPINLYRRLRHMRGFRFDSLKDHDRIGIEDGMLGLRKTSGTYKDFGKSFYEVWRTPSTTTPPSSSPCLAKRPQTSTPPSSNSTATSTSSPVYKWQDVVLPMAIEAHTFIVAQQPTDPSK